MLVCVCSCVRACACVCMRVRVGATFDASPKSQMSLQSKKIHTPPSCAPPSPPFSHAHLPHRAHGDMFVGRCIALLTDVINNRLYERVRERGGLVYSVDMAFDPLFYADAGFFTLALAPFPEKMEVAVDLGACPHLHVHVVFELRAVDGSRHGRGHCCRCARPCLPRSRLRACLRA